MNAKLEHLHRGAALFTEWALNGAHFCLLCYRKTVITVLAATGIVNRIPSSGAGAN